MKTSPSLPIPFSFPLPPALTLTLTLCCALALPFSSAFAEDPLTLGKTIGGMEFEERTDYEQKALGYSLRYNGEDLLKADVYVYNQGLPNLPDGIASPEIREEMALVKLSLQKMGELGRYQNVTELSSDVRKFEGLKAQFLWVRYSYQQAAGEGVAFTGPRISDTYLLIHRGHFIKVRITTKQSDLEKHQPAIEQFVKEVAKQLE